MNESYLALLNKIDFETITDHPNILIAAAFWEEERYMAARICYKYLRMIDDLIDNQKSEHAVLDSDIKTTLSKRVENWLSEVENGLTDDKNNNELLQTIKKFHIPLWTLKEFSTSMMYDINYNGFRTLKDFLTYSQGASVAPASIFVHLNGLTRLNGKYIRPVFNVRDAATPCAIFSYIVHIIRDFRKDQLHHLNYFAEDELQRNGLLPSDLAAIAAGGPIPEGFRNMISNYCKLADTYRQSTLKVIEDIFPLLEPQYRLSLRIIFNLYLMVYERIDSRNGTFSTEELNPTPYEIKQRVYDTIKTFRE